jgi:hypothetical protein
MTVWTEHKWYDINNINIILLCIIYRCGDRGDDDDYDDDDDSRAPQTVNTLVEHIASTLGLLIV